MRYLRPPQRSGFFWDNPIRMTPFQVPACCPNTNGINDAMPTEGFRPTSCSFSLPAYPCKGSPLFESTDRPETLLFFFSPKKDHFPKTQRSFLSTVLLVRVIVFFAWLGTPRSLSDFSFLIFFFGSSQSSRAEEADVLFHHNFLAGPNTDLGGCAEHPSKASRVPKRFVRRARGPPLVQSCQEADWLLNTSGHSSSFGFLWFYEGSGYVCFFGHFRGCAIAA